MTGSSQLPPPSHPDNQADDSAYWIAATLGLMLVAAGGFVLYETFQLFASGSESWLTCLRGGDVLLEGCGEDVQTAYIYRFGVDALTAMGIALAVVFIGPIPLIVALNRMEGSIIAGVLFFVVVIPYGILAFLVMIIAILVVVFYGLQFTPA